VETDMHHGPLFQRRDFYNIKNHWWYCDIFIHVHNGHWWNSHHITFCCPLCHFLLFPLLF
jgi:hypothetical protein